MNRWNSIKVWANAFIPLNVPGYTKVVPKGPFKNRTMIPGPFAWSDCFLTDQRDFSEHIHAKSRMHCEARVDLLTNPPKMTQWHNCDFTTECDCDDGEEECHEQGKTTNMSYVMAYDPKLSTVRLNLAARAWNPCSPASAVGGEIDMKMKFVLDTTNKTLVCSATVDSFPAFEAYATINDGAGVAIFHQPPPTGRTVMDLPGEATTMIAPVMLVDPGSGVFERRSAKRSPPSKTGLRQSSRQARPR
jgi:hypothetical protein